MTPCSRDVIEDACFGVVKRLYLEQRARAADFVFRFRLSHHEPFAAKALDAGELFFHVCEIADDLLRMDTGPRGFVAVEHLLAVLDAFFEMTAVFRSVENDVTNL